MKGRFVVIREELPCADFSFLCSCVSRNTLDGMVKYHGVTGY